jgi:hypothetical protein
MEFNIFLLFGLLVSGLITAKFLYESIFFPKEGKIHAIMVWEKLSSIIDPSETDRIHFFLWPIFKVHEFCFKTSEFIKISDKKPGDTLVWSAGENCVIERGCKTNFFDPRRTIFVVTENVYTSEDALVTIVTSHTLEIVNPPLAIFAPSFNHSIDFVKAKISGVIREIVSSHSVQDLSKFGTNEDFSGRVCAVNAGLPSNPHDGTIEVAGVEITHSVFIAITPGNEQAKNFFDARLEPEIAEQKALADVKKAEAEQKVYNLKTEAMARRLKETGLTKTDANGAVTRNPDPDRTMSPQVAAALPKDLKTLIINTTGDKGSVQPVIDIND